VDLNGDGVPDMLSGCWPGELYFFRGLGKGKFAAAQKLKDKDGKEINLGSASTVFAADWRGTGRLDLLVGSIDGHVFLVPNDGTKTKPAFGKAEKLKADGQEIRVPHGDSHPIMADWEKTGKPGLVVGCGDGSVLWYRNIGTRAEPRLAAPQTLVAAPKQEGPAHRPFFPAGVPGTRAKVCVVDWNGTGRLDLLVGDFGFHQGPAPKLTEADQKAKKELEAKLQKLNKELQPFFDVLQKSYDEAAKQKNTPEAKKERDKKVSDASARY
jgi:hypothetical protein